MNHSLFFVLMIAVAAPLLAGIPRALRVPALALEILFGILVGPHLLGLIKADGILIYLGENVGLAALFFMVGLELDLEKYKGQPLTLAIQGWLFSFVISLIVAALCAITPFIHTPMILALAFASSALGIIVPLLSDTQSLHTQFGKYLLSAVAFREFAPIVGISLFLTNKYSSWIEIVLLLLLAMITMLAVYMTSIVKGPKLAHVLSKTTKVSNQLPIRLTMLLLAFLTMLSSRFGFEVIPGAFAAGIVVGFVCRGADGNLLRLKIEAITYGFLIPFFFVVSGLEFNLNALTHSKIALVMVPVFIGLFLIVHGSSVLFYKTIFDFKEKISFVLYTSTSLPLVIAIAQFTVKTGQLSPEMAASLVSAALLTVILFPTIARLVQDK